MSDNIRRFDPSTASSAAVNQTALQTMRQTTESYFAWQRELVRFATARLQRNAEFGQAFVSARNWSDAIKLQQEWAQSTIDDFTEETKKLMEIAAGAGAEAARGAEDIGRAAGDMGSEMARNAQQMGRATMESGADAARSTAATASDTARETAQTVRDMSEAARDRAKRGRER